jgi:hypothetical protein
MSNVGASHGLAPTLQSNGSSSLVGGAWKSVSTAFRGAGSWVCRGITAGWKSLTNCGRMTAVPVAPAARGIASSVINAQGAQEKGQRVGGLRASAELGFSQPAAGLAGPAQLSSKPLEQLIALSQEGMALWCAQNDQKTDKTAVFVGTGWEPLKDDLNAVFENAGGTKMGNVIRSIATRIDAVELSPEFLAGEISQRHADMTRALSSLKPFLKQTLETVAQWQRDKNTMGATTTVLRNLVLERGVAESARRLAEKEPDPAQKNVYVRIAQMAEHMARPMQVPLPADFPKSTGFEVGPKVTVGTATSQFTTSINEWIHPPEDLSLRRAPGDGKGTRLETKSAPDTPESDASEGDFLVRPDKQAGEMAQGSLSSSGGGDPREGAVNYHPAPLSSQSTVGSAELEASLASPRLPELQRQNSGDPANPTRHTALPQPEGSAAGQKLPPKKLAGDGLPIPPLPAGLSETVSPLPTLPLPPKKT